jgi:deoxyribodipyrimidine photo-lyase
MYDYDYYLHEPGTIVNGTGHPYQKFTPYYHTALKKPVQPPAKQRKLHLKQSQAVVPNKISLSEALSKFTHDNPDILVHGGRSEAIKTLKSALRTQSHYSKTRNDLDAHTTLLSAYIKFGCVSIREVYKTLRSYRELIRQLIWRDFYANVLYSFPKNLGKSMKPAYNKIRWHHNNNWLNAWKKGETGFPIVDAGMRELNVTGYMHNRARLITSSFLIKTLLIDWREGEEYFAQQLTDYDPASNNGNWQWTAGTGTDSQPYFRVLNPWLQQEEYDKDCNYIKKWIPELKELDPKVIHKWNDEWKNYKDIKYHKPICNYEEQKKKVLQMYKDIH